MSEMSTDNVTIVPNFITASLKKGRYDGEKSSSWCTSKCAWTSPHVVRMDSYSVTNSPATIHDLVKLNSVPLNPPLISSKKNTSRNKKCLILSLPWHHGHTCTCMSWHYGEMALNIANRFQQNFVLQLKDLARRWATLSLHTCQYSWNDVIPFSLFLCLSHIFSLAYFEVLSY